MYEYAYNHNGPVPTDTWTTENVLNGSFWISPLNNGSNAPGCNAYDTFATITYFNDTCFGGAGQLAGFDMFMGNSVEGLFDGAVDNVTVAVNGEDGTNYNFELDAETTTPEPATLALLAPFLLAAVPAFRRKRA